MSKFTDHLWQDLVDEHGPALAHDDRTASGRAGGAAVLRRPRVVAGSTLGLVAVGAALVLALGGSSAPPAFAITTNHDGSVLVNLNYTADQNLPQVDRKLAAMGIHEQIEIDMASGAATVSGPVTCTPASGVSGPTVKVLVGTNGTEVIAPGQSAGNTAEGSFHLVSCSVHGDTGNTGSGNTGNG